MEENNLKKYASALSKMGASKGGKARAQKLTKAQRQDIARRAAEARWERSEEMDTNYDIPKATKYIGQLDLGGYKISAAVLDNGQRVLVERSMARALGKKGAGAYWRKKRASIQSQKGALLPEYISAKYLEKYVKDELKKKLQKPIRYVNPRGILTTGVDATVLPEICDVWIAAQRDGALDAEQSKIADRAYVLMKGFATVGIIALIDEVTGYQEIRSRLDLQEILDTSLAEIPMLRNELNLLSGLFEEFGELLRDPDSGLELRPEVRQRLLESSNTPRESLLSSKDMLARLGC